MLINKLLKKSSGVTSKHMHVLSWYIVIEVRGPFRVCRDPILYFTGR